MEYSEYAEKEKALLNAKAYHIDEHKKIMDSYSKTARELLNEYLGVFAIGNPVKVLNRPEYEGQKFYVEEETSIYSGKTALSIRKAKKDGSYNCHGTKLWYVDINDLEAWNEL